MSNENCVGDVFGPRHGAALVRLQALQVFCGASVAVETYVEDTAGVSGDEPRLTADDGRTQIVVVEISKDRWEA